VRNLFLAVLFEEFTQLGRVDLAAAEMEKRAAAMDATASSKKLSQPSAEPGFMEKVANSAFLGNCSIALVLVIAISLECLGNCSIALVLVIAISLECLGNCSIALVLVIAIAIECR
jgi:multidrug efflux pump subunit AcrB